MSSRKSSALVALPHSGSTSDADESRSSRHSSSRTRKRRTATTATKVNPLGTSTTSDGSLTHGSIIFAFLLLGLLFCLLDCFYIFHYVWNDRHHHTANNINEAGGAISTATTDRWASSGSHHLSEGASRRTVLDPLPASKQIENASPSAAKEEGGGKEESTDDEEEKGRKPAALEPLPERSADEKSQIQAILQDPERARLLELLRDANVEVASLPLETLQQLPKWSDVTAMYGTGPVYYGLETCQDFQRSADPAEHFVATAGTFNTGTNLMAELLIENCRMPARIQKYGARNRGVRWQVLWGKHTPVFNESFRIHHKTYEDADLEATHMFPAVTVRDPYKWMQSMCRHEYGADWRHSSDHCPNLVPNAVDEALNAQRHPNDPNNRPIVTPTGGVPVAVQYKEFRVEHDTLVGFWNDWYNEYVNVSWPRLIVRFEDLVFYPQEVTKTVCECAGGELNPNQPFKFIVESAKHGAAAHGKERTTYIDALVKYGTEKGRYKGFEDPDLEYARQHLSPKLLEIFQYKQAPSKESLAVQA